MKLRSILNAVASPAIDDPTKTICEAEATYNQPSQPPDYDVIAPVLEESVVSNFLRELTLVLLFTGERKSLELTRVVCFPLNMMSYASVDL